MPETRGCILKHAIITGARGFIGRHLARYLSTQGYHVSGLGHGAWTEKDAQAWGVSNWLNGEVCTSNLDKLAEDSGIPDCLFNLAGGSTVGASMATPEEDFQRTVTSCSRVLEWLRHSAPRCRAVLASSAAVYGSGHVTAIRETDTLHPYSPYGYHKRIAELLFESYARNFGLSTSCVRLFSVYGPELRKQLCWDFCNRLLARPTELTLTGTGDELRDWIDVRDAAACLASAAELANSECFVINGGTGHGISVREIVGEICHLWGESVQLHFSGERRRGDPNFLVADTSLATLHNIRPKIDWHQGLENYVVWFKASVGST